MSNLKKDIDEIVFRCFAQGQYWGTEADGKLDPGYKPEKPIDRTQAVNNILNLIESVIPKSKNLAYRQGRQLPVLTGIEAKDLNHVKVKKYINFGYNQAIKDIKNKLIGGTK